MHLLHRFGLPLKAIELFHEVWQVDLFDVLSASAVLPLLESELPHFEDVWLIMHRSESHRQVELPGEVVSLLNLPERISLLFLLCLLQLLMEKAVLSFLLLFR